MKLLITGASSGIGAACARHFASAGWSIILSGRNADRLQAVHDSLPGEGHSTLVADVAEWAENPKAIPDFGPIGGLVWSAGVCQLAGRLHAQLKSATSYALGQSGSPAAGHQSFLS